MEFLGWGSATILPLSMPLATLLASIMTFGNLGENNELLAMKAAGISLQRIFLPLIFVAFGISVAAFFVSKFHWLITRYLPFSTISRGPRMR